MKDRFCWIVVTIQLLVLVVFAYIIGIHAEKIGWLEDQALEGGHYGKGTIEGREEGRTQGKEVTKI